MAATVYLVGVDPQARRPIVATPILHERFTFAPKFFHPDYVRGAMAADQACYLQTDSHGFDRLLRVVAEMEVAA